MPVLMRNLTFTCVSFGILDLTGLTFTSVRADSIDTGTSDTKSWYSRAFVNICVQRELTWWDSILKQQLCPKIGQNVWQENPPLKRTTFTGEAQVFIRVMPKKWRNIHTQNLFHSKTDRKRVDWTVFWVACTLDLRIMELTTSITAVWSSMAFQSPEGLDL